MSNLLLIESPGKLKKLSQILGPGWVVKASMGHVRELANDGEDALGFDLDGDRVRCRYEPRGDRGKKVLADLRKAVRQAEAVYIATDPDREGETIGWHLQQELRLQNPRRIVYSEITPTAVQQALANSRQLDELLIAAGRARECLDKLVGYKGSKYVVWPLNNGAKSMGRVQSAALHLLCRREREIGAFRPQDYWTVWVEYEEGFKALYCRSSKPPDSSIAAPVIDDAVDIATEPESTRVLDQAEADRWVAIAHRSPHQVIHLDSQESQQSPPAPLTTSTLQQVAGSKFRWSPDKTMNVAQALYEAGHITYMRTDSVSLSGEFCQAVRQFLSTTDPENVPDRIAKHRAAKGAQEAHEAIRPTRVDATPASLQTRLDADAAQLYSLIWNRAIASQCCPARLQKTHVLLQSGSICWEARGQILIFAGYTRYWNNLSADAQLPMLKQGQVVHMKRSQADKKKTQPPPRYTEPKMVQLMERQGIGRPSTYATILKTLRDRAYVELSKDKLVPTQLGQDLNAALEMLLPDLIQPQFTAQMETALDEIAQGRRNWQSYLTGWYQSYFAPALIRARQQLETGGLPGQSQSVQSQIETTQISCPKCSQLMQKIPSRSTKLKADHFLRCESAECETVMFWNASTSTYELPYAHRDAALDPQLLTEFPCPVCGQKLERYSYKKDGKTKDMLRCSVVQHRQNRCKDVAFFNTPNGLWSPKFGNL